MAIPTGPASRPKKKFHEETLSSSAQLAPGPVNLAPIAAAASASVPIAAALAPAAVLVPSPNLAVERSHRPTSRQSQRIPSEIFARDATLSPAVLGLSVAEFLEVLYQDALKPDELSVEEFFRMRDQAAWPEPFAAGDPRHLFTEDMCRRGQFVHIGWNSDGLCFATCRDDHAQDELMRALDMLVQLPVTLYTAQPEAVDAGITWLYRR